MPNNTVANAITAILQARNMADLMAEYDRLFPTASRTAAVYGVEKADGVSIERVRKEANERVLAVLQRVGADASLLTEDDRAILRQYSGLGGIGGSIHEYYTPQWVASGIWDLMAAMGQGPGNYLEPSAGAGVFHGTKPAGALMTATEIDDTSAQVNQLLHPEDKVMNQCFEQLAVSTEDDSWDGAVGNVPFGETRGSYGALDPEYAHIKFVDQYFVSRILDKIKSGALMTVVVPMRIVSGAKFKKWRAEISLKAEFLGAHRLPSGTFSNNGTDTATDILVMRKHPAGLAELVNGRKKAALEDANVLWDTFINGKWFESAEGKRFIHGEQSIQGAGKFARTVVEKGATTNDQIKQRLAHKFQSRIDWPALELAEPVTPTFEEGDDRMINGRWRRLVNGTWQTTSLVGNDGDTISKDEYGVGSLRQLKTMLEQSPLNALELNHTQLLAVHRDFPDTVDGIVGDAIRLAKEQPAEHRTRIVRGAIIGHRIQGMLGEINEVGIIPAETAAELRNLISNEISTFGVAAADRKLATLGGGNAAGAWNAFVTATDVNGQFSALLKGTLDRGPVRAFDDTSAAQTVAYLFGQLELNPVDLSDFLDLYRGDEGKTLVELAKIPGVAITPAGMLMPMDRATSGNIVETRRKVMTAMGAETDPAILTNYQVQLDEIERRRYRAKVDDIEMTMAAKWLPRSYVGEFLREQGYRELQYSKIVTNENGELVDDTEYQGNDGVWSGYSTRGGKKRTNANEQFERQLENYLNGVTVRSGDAAGAAAYRDRIKGIEERFAIWLRQHDDVDKLADLYNDSFNGHVAFEHSDADLELEGISGRIVPFGYQCSGIRRASEDGRGTLAFGTGLGKTPTALGLAAYNKQMGRAKRTGIAVPLAVLENWYHEAKTFYNDDAFSRVFFVGLEPVRNKDGAIELEQILDDDGNPRLGANNEALTRDKLKSLSAKEVKARLNAIPQSNYDVVVMSKEQLATIPMRPESIVAHADRMESAGLRGGKILAAAKNHREAMKKEKFAEKHSNTGTVKALDIPYWEDMGFDNLIIDEAHNYRNSYQAGRESSKLAYLPTQASAKMAIDLAVKSSYMREKHNGRGPVLLTATPTVNSPIDIFNMLSHVLSIEEWGLMGITDVDDFIKVFGEVEDVLVQKLSGEVESKQGLVGFKNLSGLRSLFHRWVNLKDAKDVSHTVTIPDLEETLTEADMTAEQATVYEELRQRAEALSKGQSNDDNGNPTDFTFAIIRDMDRVCSDMDLYRRTMTFRFPLKYGEAVEKLVADLPTNISSAGTDEDKQDEEADKTVIQAKLDAKLTTGDHAITLVVPDVYEQEVVSRLEKFGITSSDVSHPLMPKYARMLENLKRGHNEGGKQIIFTEEKSQHEKLKRIIVNSLGIPAEQIGIINAKTVSEKGVDGEQASLEGFAGAYNEGKIRILICNKKAEVGVNLHHGTTDIHHLTLPWTPASIKQRNGRGARVGAKQKKVRVHYYVGKGSFDQFRLDTLKRKANWQNELFTSDAEKMKNADADDAMDASLLLAADPEERRARIEANQAKARAKIEEAARRRAGIDLHNFLKAAHDMGGDPAEIQASLVSLQQQITQLNEQAKNSQEWAERNLEQSKTDQYSGGYYLQKYRGNLKEVEHYNDQARKVHKSLIFTERKLERTTKAADALKRLRPSLEQAMKKGLLDAPADILDKGYEYLTDGIVTVRLGRNYQTGFGEIVRVDKLDFDGKQAQVTLIHIPYKSKTPLKPGSKSWYGIGSLKTEVSYTPSELEVWQEMSSALPLARAVQLLDAGQFSQHLITGALGLVADYYLLHSTDGAGFEVVYHPSYSDKPMTKDQRGRIVYPDSSNAGLKSKLAQWLMADRTRMAKSSYGNSQEAPAAWLTALYGANVVAAVEEYGNKAPDQVVNEWLAASLDSYRSTNKISPDRISLYHYYFESYARKLIPSEWSNRTAFEAAIKAGEKILEDEGKLEAKAIQARKDAEAVARFELARQDSNRDAIIERLVWVRDTGRSYRESNGYTVAGKLRSEKEAPYIVDGSFNLAQGVADMVAAGLMVAPAEITTSSLRQAWDSGVYNLFSNHSATASALQTWIDGDKPKEEPAPEPTQEDQTKTATADATLEAVNAGDTRIGTVLVRRNAMPINQPASKTQFRGRWRTRPAVNKAVGEVIGLFDQQGKMGVLYDKKENIKAAFGAGRGLVFFTDSVSDEYPGGWWFIPATATLQEIANVLGVDQ
ncbi:helicase-related protein [Aeromonas salmonicida]|uniref:helicase-related protein n=1 Tax=Aeromonas salmonicida TaxID=645 RepID=UPI0023312A5A|nr:helicase-related protein [Aeromonas salmonicida]WCH25188.1 helicase-related protein [Aeromonas salmonicida]